MSHPTVRTHNTPTENRSMTASTDGKHRNLRSGDKLVSLVNSEGKTAETQDTNAPIHSDLKMNWKGTLRVSRIDLINKSISKFTGQ
ncbi:hypothetical protein PM082_017830 [Marasmius tenuissimus]|nr:hypothetical protein PM082_017830 [Marasmius tenuissimus]